MTPSRRNWRISRLSFGMKSRWMQASGCCCPAGKLLPPQTWQAKCCETEAEASKRLVGYTGRRFDGSNDVQQFSQHQCGGRGTRTPTGLRPAVFKTAAIPLCEPSVKNRSPIYSHAPHPANSSGIVAEESYKVAETDSLPLHQLLMQNIFPHLLLQPYQPCKPPVGGNQFGVGSGFDNLPLRHHCHRCGVADGA